MKASHRELSEVGLRHGSGAVCCGCSSCGCFECYSGRRRITFDSESDAKNFPNCYKKVVLIIGLVSCFLFLEVLM
jgi:hypothetical protein